MSFFTKKPVTIEARRFETNNDDGTHMTLLCDWANDPKGKAVVTHDGTCIYIATLEGTMRADCGDWIIRGVEGELYPCKDSIFQATYAPAVPAQHRKSFEGGGRGLTFGQALEQLKDGDAVARDGWNGKGMFLLLVPGSQGLTVEEGRPLAKAGIPIGTRFDYLPHIDLWTAQGAFVPWFASQADLLAEDWCVVQRELAAA